MKLGLRHVTVTGLVPPNSNTIELQCKPFKHSFVLRVYFELKDK